MQAAGTMAKRPETEAVGPEEAWAAVLARDGRYDGRLVYAVRSTGIYCRPSCPSRRPHRQHVAFFDTPASARAAESSSSRSSAWRAASISIHGRVAASGFAVSTNARASASAPVASNARA